MPCSSSVTTISRKRRDIENQDNYEKSREFHEEHIGRRINPIESLGKEIFIILSFRLYLVIQIKIKDSVL